MEEGDTGNVRFVGNLDPTAEEFRPTNHYTQINLLPTHLYHPYPFYDGYRSLQLPGYGCPPPLPQPVAAPQPLPPPPPPPSTGPSRALLLTSVPNMVTEETIRRELEFFGEVRVVQMERLQEGSVTVHFYDLRHAQKALVQIQEQHMQQQDRLRQHYNMLQRQQPWESLLVPVPVPPPCVGLIAGRAVWAQFSLPVGLPVSDGHNQGTIVVFNLDSGISTCKLKEIFQAFGEVKEVRETPFKRNQKFVEFYDIRDADRAIKEMDGKEINGKCLLIEFSKPGGQRGRFSTTFNNSRSSFNSRIPNYPTPTPPSPPPPPPPPKSFRRSNSDASSSSSGKKPSFSRGSSGWNGRRARELVGPLASLSVDGSVSSTKKNNSKKSQNKKQLQQEARSNRPWKGRQNNHDSHFLIKEDAIFESKFVKDTRTTVMIKNIPNKYSQKLLLHMLDNHCINCNEQIGDGEDQPLSSYDFVYLPIDFNNKCNVGYGFVNLTSPQATLRLYKAFHLQHWEVFNSRKICEITYARLQGLEALEEHFKNSKFACETDEYLPVLFNPPRDGKQLTEPMPIGGHSNTSTPTEKKKQFFRDDMMLHGDDGGSCDDGEGNNEEDDVDESRHLRSKSSSATSSITSSVSTCGEDGQMNVCLTACTEPQQEQQLAQGFVSCSGY